MSKLNLSGARLVTLVALLSSPALVAARGGGGGHGFHSSGYSSHYGGYSSSTAYVGGGGYSSGSPDMIYIVIIFFIVIIVAAYYFRSNKPAADGQQQSWSNQQPDDVDSMLPVMMDEDGVLWETPGVDEAWGTVAAVRAADRFTLGLGTGLQQLQSADPDFDVERFLQRAEMTFMLLRRAELANSEADGRPFLTPELFAAWSAPLQQRRAQGLEFYSTGLNIRRIDFVQIQTAPTGDTCVVHLDVVAAQYAFDPAHNRIIWGSTEEVGSGIRMTFTRNNGTRTVLSGGVTAKKCPSCAAPLTLTSTGVCSFCQAAVASGAFDWTVSSIDMAPYLGQPPTPEMLITPLDPRLGLAALKERDTAFDESTFLARVKTIFMTVQQAWQARDAALGQAYMSEGLFLAWRTQLEQMVRLHRKNVLENLEIIDVTPITMFKGKAFDTITLQITARAADYELDDRTGNIVFGNRRVSQFTEYWSLQRTVDTATGAFSIAEKQCPRCGAPLQVSEIGECTYCSAAITSGSFDWVLSRITQPEE